MKMENVPKQIVARAAVFTMGDEILAQNAGYPEVQALLEIRGATNG